MTTESRSQIMPVIHRFREKHRLQDIFQITEESFRQAY